MRGLSYIASVHALLLSSATADRFLDELHSGAWVNSGECVAAWFACELNLGRLVQEILKRASTHPVRDRRWFVSDCSDGLSQYVHARRMLEMFSRLNNKPPHRCGIVQAILAEARKHDLKPPDVSRRMCSFILKNERDFVIYALHSATSRALRRVALVNGYCSVEAASIMCDLSKDDAVYGVPAGALLESLHEFIELVACEYKALASDLSDALD